MVIILQDMVLSRYVANLLIKEYSPYFRIKDGTLINVQRANLLKVLEEGSIEEREVLMYL